MLARPVARGHQMTILLVVGTKHVVTRLIARGRHVLIWLAVGWDHSIARPVKRRQRHTTVCVTRTRRWWHQAASILWRRAGLNSKLLLKSLQLLRVRPVHCDWRRLATVCLVVIWRRLLAYAFSGPLGIGIREHSFPR